MKTLPSIFLVSFILFMLAGCESSDHLAQMQMLAETPEENHISEEVCNQVNLGMTTEEVKSLLGEPAKTLQQKTVIGNLAVWTYGDLESINAHIDCMINFKEGQVDMVSVH